MKTPILLSLLLSSLCAARAAGPAGFVFRESASAAPEPLRQALPEADIFPGPDGDIWLHDGAAMLFKPRTGARLTTDRNLRQTLATPDGGVIAATDRQWGFLIPIRNGRFHLVFQPASELPLLDCRMAVSATGEILFFGKRNAGDHTLLIFDPAGAAPADYVPLLRCREPIAAATADKMHAYAACGDTVHRIALFDGKAEPESWLRVPEKITGLVADGRGGLFIATERQVLHAGAEGVRSLIAANRPRLTHAEGTLHILKEDLSVISLEWPPEGQACLLKEAAATKAAIPETKPAGQN